ncbi:MAG TPA: MBL fold metallo-hydrolase [Candidatus Cybelea sp.]
MIVRVLGSAAGGGVPQWNCACANCTAAREGRQPRRTQSSVAVSAGGARWLLLNCSPDVAAQIEEFAPLHPERPRGTPIAGMLVTDANVDHLGGLAVLRQHGERGFVVRSSGVVRAIATAQTAFAPFARLPHHWLEAPLGAPCDADGDDDLVGNQLTVRAIPVPGTTPGYYGRRRVRGAVVAYEIADCGSDKRLLFAPVFADIDDTLERAIESASFAFLDGSFYSDDELVAQGLASKSARSLGHLPVGGAGGTLERLRGMKTRVIFTHVNNSNPMLDPDSPAAALVRELGAEIAFDGMELRL